MKSPLWMSAAASIALLVAATGCNANNAGNTAGDVARGTGQAVGQVAGDVGNAVNQGARGFGNAAGQGMDRIGNGVQQGINGAANVGRGAMNGLNQGARQGTNAMNGYGNYAGNNASADIGNAMNQPGAPRAGVAGTTPARNVAGWGNPNDISSVPSVNVNNKTRTVTVQFRNLTPDVAAWHVGHLARTASQHNMELTIPAGWTLHVANASQSYGHVSLGIVPFATAMSPANGTLTKTLTSTLPGRYHIVAQTPARTRDIIGIVTFMPGAAGINISYGQQR